MSSAISSVDGGALVGYRWVGCRSPDARSTEETFMGDKTPNRPPKPKKPKKPATG